MSKIFTPNFNKVFAMFFFCSIMCTNHLLAVGGDNLSRQCLDKVDFTSDFGTPVDTFEDVDPVTNIGYTLTGDGPTMKRNKLNHYKNCYTKKDDGEAFIDKINNTGGRILANHFNNFMKKHFFVKGPIWAAGNPPELGKPGKGGKKSLLIKMKDFVKSMFGKKCKDKKYFDWNKTSDPSIVKFVLCLDGGWDYIPAKNYFPDAISCNVDRHLCDYGPCEKGIKKNSETGERKEFIGDTGECDSEDVDEEEEDLDLAGDGGGGDSCGDDSGDSCGDDSGDSCGDDSGSGTSNWIVIKNPIHVYKKNLFTDLGNKIEDTIDEGYGLPNGRSTLDTLSLDPSIPLSVDTKSEFVMRFADRTPPRILGCVGGNFPELGKDKPATTGDWYKLNGIWAEDNTGCDIGMCLVLGKIDSFPSKDWDKSEKWVKEKATTFSADSQPNYVILPNTCHGAMHYSIFAWDTSNLMNPGEPLIVEDSPETCYGLRNPPIPNLGTSPDKTSPNSAKPWPIKFTGEENIKGEMRRGQGILHVRDNDLPNIVIKIESMKNHKKIFFPPIIADGELPIYDSSEYSSPNSPNTKEYSTFIDGAEAKYFSSYLENSTDSPFVILDAKPSSVMSPAESAKISSFISGSDKKLTSFARKYFRLEDYAESDTKKSDGKPREDEDTFGSRNSFGKSVVALLNEPLQEDVEYKISVWADDNVKWATVDKSGTILTKIISIPSGIDSGNIELNIPNQVPAYMSNTTMDKNSSLSKEIKAVFREPTEGPCSSIAQLIAKRYPYIKVSVTDFSGLKREITLYFIVKNEKPVIRVLEHKHGTI